MAAIPGSVRVTGFIAPSDTTDLYPSHDAIWGRGGLRSVADAAERNAITDQRRAEGMIVTQNDTGQCWKLNASPWVGTDADWSLVNFGGGGTFTNTALTNAVAVTVDETLVDDYGEITWKVVLWNTDGRRETWTVEGTNDGIPAADATAPNYSVAGKGPDNGNTIEVDLNGAGVAQTMRLRITANGIGWTAAWLRVDSSVAGAN